VPSHNEKGESEERKKGCLRRHTGVENGVIAKHRLAEICAREGEILNIDGIVHIRRHGRVRNVESLDIVSLDRSRSGDVSHWNIRGKTAEGEETQVWCFFVVLLLFRGSAAEGDGEDCG
jgi:hypothetical protein